MECVLFLSDMTSIMMAFLTSEKELSLSFDYEKEGGHRK